MVVFLLLALLSLVSGQSFGPEHFIPQLTVNVSLINPNQPFTATCNISAYSQALAQSSQYSVRFLKLTNCQSTLLGAYKVQGDVVHFVAGDANNQTKPGPRMFPPVFDLQIGDHFGERSYFQCELIDERPHSEFRFRSQLFSSVQPTVTLHKLHEHQLEHSFSFSCEIGQFAPQGRHFQIDLLGFNSTLLNSYLVDSRGIPHWQEPLERSSMVRSVSPGNRSSYPFYEWNCALKFNLTFLANELACVLRYGDTEYRSNEVKVESHLEKEIRFGSRSWKRWRRHRLITGLACPKGDAR